MKVKVKIAITSVFILILSVLNIRSGIVFKTKDNTERDAQVFTLVEKTETKEKSNIDIKTANIPAPAYSSTYRYSYSSSNSGSNYQKSGKDFADCTDYSNVLGILNINGRDMTVVDACKVYENGSLYIITPSRPGYVAKYGTLIYAHNTASGLGDLGSALSITYNGAYYHRTDIVNVTRADANRSMGSYVNGYPKLYLMTCSGTNYGNGDASHRLVAGFSK